MRVPGQNFRIALRTLGRTPGFAALAVLTLGLGIGANVRPLLYGVAPTDPWSLTAVAAPLVAASALACAIPARRAGRLDPVQVLRSE